MKYPTVKLPKLIPYLFLLLPPAVGFAQEDVVYAAEPFDYAAFNGMFNLDGGTAWGWTGSWTREIGDDGIIRRGDLGPADGEGGTHASLEFVRAGIRYNRSLTLLPDAGQDVWITATLDWRPGSAANNVGNITLTNAGQQVLSFGRKFGNRRIAIVLPGGVNFETDVQAEGVHELLLKIEMSGDASAERAYLWVDPPADLPSGGPSVTSADANTPPGRLRLNAGIDGVQLKVEGTPPLSVGYDRLAIGGSYRSVQPDFVVSIPFSEVPSGVELSVSPNPVSNLFNVSFRLPHRGSGRLDLLDAGGRVLRNLYEGDFAAGLTNQHYSVGDGDLPGGVYILRLSGAGLYGTCRLVVK